LPATEIPHHILIATVLTLSLPDFCLQMSPKNLSNIKTELNTAKKVANISDGVRSTMSSMTLDMNDFSYQWQ